MERLDPVVEEEDLALAADLAPKRLADELLVVGPDVGANRAPALRRRLDHGDVAQPREAHLHGPRDRRRRHREHVDLELELAQQLLLLDAEALLLVDHEQPEVLGADVAGEQPVGADQDVERAVGEAGQRALDLGRLAEAGDHLDLVGEVAQPLAERPEVLGREDRRRHQDHHLLGVGERLLGRADRDLGLAVADVSADQPIHRPLRFHVRLDRLDRLELVGGLAERERPLEPELPLAVGGELMAAAGLTLGVEVDQLAGHLASGAASLRLHLRPALAAELRELGTLAAADVAGDLGELLGGDEDLVPVAVLELEVVAGDPGDGAGVEAGEAGDAVVLVDDVLAGGQVAERGEPAAGRRRSGGAAAVDETPERDHRQLQGGRDEPVGDLRLGEGDRGLGRRRALAEQLRRQPVEPVAGPLRLADPLEGDDGQIARADLLLELRLGLAEAARGGDRDRGAECPAPSDLAVGQARSG